MKKKIILKTNNQKLRKILRLILKITLITMGEKKKAKMCPQRVQ